MRRLFGAFVDAIVHSFIWLSSNKALFASIFVVTLTWMVYNLLAPHPFDDWAAGLPKLVFWYTIIFGLWEGAQKISQAIQIREDARVAALMQQTLASIETLAVDIRAELDRARDRDEASAQRDEVLRALCEQLLEDIERKKNGGTRT